MYRESTFIFQSSVITDEQYGPCVEPQEINSQCGSVVYEQ